MPPVKRIYQFNNIGREVALNWGKPSARKSIETHIQHASTPELLFAVNCETVRLLSRVCDQLENMSQQLSGISQQLAGIAVQQQVVFQAMQPTTDFVPAKTGEV